MNQRSNKFLNNHFFDQYYESVWTKDGYDRLRTYFGTVWEGQPKVYTAPFAKGESIGSVMQAWDGQLVSISDKWPSLYEFEKDLERKVGPLSTMLPFLERLGDVAHYYEDILLSSTPVDPAAVQAVINEFSGLRGLRLRSVGETVKLMKKSTNSGSPYFTKRRNVVQDTIPCRSAASIGRHPTVVVKLSKWDGWEAAATIGWRGQEGGPSKEDVKQRVVWMFPFSVNVNELQVYQPFIEGSQKLNLVPAWVSMESVDARVTALFDTKGKDDLVVCTDFSRFDQHFNADLQNAGATILGKILTGDAKSREWLRDVYPIKFMIPLAIPWDKNDHGIVTYLEGLHGMASGSGGTNVDETIVHRSLQYEAAMLSNQTLNPNSQCLGDDGILSYPSVTVEDVVGAYSRHGQECNPAKQYASTQDCVYLRRWHHMNYRDHGVCVGVYSTMRAIGRLRYLERYMDPEYWSPELVALRQLSIIENCKWHPLRDQFAEFCMKRDKYRLGIDLPGFLDNVEKLAKESIDHMPDFLGYTKTLQGESTSGISRWWIVNYLKSHK